MLLMGNAGYIQLFAEMATPVRIKQAGVGPSPMTVYRNLGLRTPDDRSQKCDTAWKVTKLSDHSVN